MTILSALAGAALFASAAQFHLPVHTPPSLKRPEKPVNASLGLSVGALHAAAAGLSADGPGGGWEVATRAGSSSSVHFHSEAYVFRGAVDPGAGGRRKTGGFTGNIEVDFASPLGETSGWYLGALVNTTLMDVNNPLTFTRTAGGVRLEPDLASSFTLSFPAGVRWRSDGDQGWGADAAGFVLGTLPGVTLFSYSLIPAAPPGAFGGSRKIDANVGGGASAGVEYRPWGLGLQAGGSVAASCGNNEGLSSVWGRLVWRIR